MGKGDQDKGNPLLPFKLRHKLKLVFMNIGKGKGVRITFLGAFGTARKVIYANEAIEKTLKIIYDALNK